MPSLPNWLPRHAVSEPVPGSLPIVATTCYPREKDPNAPDHRLQITAKCIYERLLPGGSYITAHIERLQSGYYDSPVIHEDLIPNVRFVAIRFVFHEACTDRRFKSATMRLSLHDENLKPEGISLPPQFDHTSNEAAPTARIPKNKPKFLRYAPHLLYGAMSPETLDWNFNLAGSLGVAQAPVSASINPSGGMKSSYKVYKMMKIQGSVRTNSSWHGRDYDTEDGELVWTLEENELQKSGLPREFTFVVMLTKGDGTNNVKFDLDIRPEVASWFGSYPQWFTHLLRYQPLLKDPLDLDVEVGQKFSPADPIQGYNFAGLMSTFENFVTLPGTLYSTTDWGASAQPTSGQGSDPSKQKQQQQQSNNFTLSPTDIKQKNSENQGNTLHLRIHLDQTSKHGHSLSTDHPRPDAASRIRRSPQSTASPSPPPPTEIEAKPQSSQNRPEIKQTRFRLVSTAPTKAQPKYKTSHITPSQTHFEEQRRPISNTKSISDDEDTDQDYIPSFPESMPSPPTQPLPKVSLSTHRPTKSTSAVATSIKPISTPPTTAATNGLPSKNTSHTSPNSLRRSRSRSGLHKASLHSEPEDEEAISAAMEMLSGSPPPAIPPTAPSLSDPTHTTPRTRATLADLLEVEEAENARIQRRNGTHDSGAYDTGHLVSRSRHPDREKRYSMPVTSTGIGYTGAGGAFQFRAANAGTAVNNASYSIGNGRSSLMIPVGAKRDDGLRNGNGYVQGDGLDRSWSVSRRREI